MRIILSLADAKHAASNTFVSLQFIVITVAIAIVLAVLFTFYC